VHKQGGSVWETEKAKKRVTITTENMKGGGNFRGKPAVGRGERRAGVRTKGQKRDHRKKKTTGGKISRVGEKGPRQPAESQKTRKICSSIVRGGSNW